MKETWRWFGPGDPVPLDHIKQAGATGIVSALHHLYRGEAWPVDEVFKRRDEIRDAGFVWSVVESIPIHNSIKLRSGSCGNFIGAWKDTLAAVAKAGVEVICYNFMPVVDWTRTDLKWRLPNTGYALRFDAVDFAAYDLFILARKGAEADYSEDRTRAARKRFETMPEARRNDLEQTIIAGLPGAEASYNRETIRGLIAEYQGVTAAELRNNLVAFLREVVPVAQEIGVRLAIHPDDPPWSLFGLPRVVSTAEDVRAIFAACETLANGLDVLCWVVRNQSRQRPAGHGSRVRRSHSLRASAPGDTRARRIVSRSRAPRRQFRYGGRDPRYDARRDTPTAHGPA